MEHTLESVLAEIRDGKQSFGPASSGDQALSDFQPVAKILAQANQRGFLDGYTVLKEHYMGKNMITTVAVMGGLTIEGEMHLQHMGKEREKSLSGHGADTVISRFIAESGLSPKTIVAKINRQMEENAAVKVFRATESTETIGAEQAQGESVHQNTASESPLSEIRNHIERGKIIIAERPFHEGLVIPWMGQMRERLTGLYGVNSKAMAHWPAKEEVTNENALQMLSAYVSRAERLLAHIDEGPMRTLAGPKDHKIFIGHGGSNLWLVLEAFITKKLKLEVIHFNHDSAAGFQTFERVEAMLESATFAFLVMTAEDQGADSKLYARDNVIHEAGLFQARLGKKRAIILREATCETFSNIAGLTDIPFPENSIRAVFEDVRDVLEREGVIASS